MHDLNIEYDASTFDTDPFEPQPDAIGTIFPVWIPGAEGGKGFVELPYTLPQDFTLFIILRERDNSTWKRKLDWIAQHGGMVLINTHPDYMNFSGKNIGNEEYPVEHYKDLLHYIKTQYAGQYWHVLPKEIATFWAASNLRASLSGGLLTSPQDVRPRNEKIAAHEKSMRRKKILMVVENSFPSDIRVKKEADVLQRFHDVSVVSLRKKRNEPLREVHEGIQIYRIPELPAFNMGKVRYILEYAYFTLSAALVFVVTYPFKRYKVVHVHNPPDTLFIVGLLGKLLRTKFVYDHHDLAPELYLTRFSGRRDIIYKALVWSERLSCKLADAIIDTNESYKKIEMDRHRIKEEKIFTVRNNPIIRDCLSDDADKNTSTSKNGKKNLLFLGAINPQDGVDILLQAVRYLVHDLKRTDFVCNILGDGDSMEQVKRLARELDLDGCVDLKGLITDRSEVRRYLSTCDIGVEPAPANPLNVHSTFIKVMEYMAAAKPVVAFDLEETRYSLGGGGILVRPGDIAGFAQAIGDLLNNPALRSELGLKGYQRVMGELTWEKASDSLKSAYRSIGL